MYFFIFIIQNINKKLFKLNISCFIGFILKDMKKNKNNNKKIKKKNNKKKFLYKIKKKNKK